MISYILKDNVDDGTLINSKLLAAIYNYRKRLSAQSDQIYICN